MPTLAGFLTAALLAQGQSLPAFDDQPIHPNRLLVRTAEGVSDSLRHSTFLAAGATELRHFPQISWSVVEIPDGKLWRTTVALQRHGEVLSVTPDRVRRAAYTPNDPQWSSMWHMMTIRADDAWDTTRGASTVRVAVVDTGVDLTHPDLSANLWTNAGEIPGNGIDDDGNGYVDDVHGYDFVYDDADPDDVDAHGTPVAGLVGAEQDNGQGVTGVAPWSQLVAVKAGDDSGLFFDSAIVPALLYCGDMGFDVAVMAFSGDGVTPAERAAVRYANERGVVLVASAGNSGSILPLYPAAYDEVISVAATQNAFDDRAFFTNYGSWCDVSAPGRNLRTTTAGGGYTTSYQGTSGSAPHVAGIAALLRAVRPGASVELVRSAIEDTAVLLSEPGYGFWSSYGRVDAAAAVDRLLGLTTGAVPARATYVAPCAGWTRPSGTPGPGAGLRRDVLRPLKLHGVGFDGGGPLEAELQGRTLQPLRRSRRTAQFAPARLTNGTTITFRKGGSTIGAIVWNREDGLAFAAVEAGSENGGVVTGGFAELYRSDGNTFRCTRNASNEVVVEYVVHGLEGAPLSQMTAQYERAYTDCGGGTETFELYDWSSGSYPNGSWVQVGTTSIPAAPSMDSATFGIANPTRWIDSAGRMYVRIVATGAGSSGRMDVDRLRFVVK